MRGTIRGGMRTGTAMCAVLFCLALAGHLRSEAQVPSTAPAPAAAQAGEGTPSGVPAGVSASPQRALINQYCVTCHNDRARTGGLSLTAFDPDAAVQHAEIAEKVIRKLRGGLMPPAGARRPDSQSAAAFVSWLENKVDAATVAPAPGR